MSNYYAKAINPKTKVEEDCVVLDMGKDNFVQFNNGMIYKAGEISEQEAINRDGIVSTISILMRMIKTLAHKKPLKMRVILTFLTMLLTGNGSYCFGYCLLVL